MSDYLAPRLSVCVKNTPELMGAKGSGVESSEPRHLPTCPALLPRQIIACTPVVCHLNKLDDTSVGRRRGEGWRAAEGDAQNLSLLESDFGISFPTLSRDLNVKRKCVCQCATQGRPDTLTLQSWGP